MTYIPDASATDLPRATLAVLIMVALIALTIWVLQPFLGPIVWALMIVVATWPVMQRLQAWLWGKRTLAVVVMTVSLLLVLVLPMSFAVTAIVSNASAIIEWSTGLRLLPLPPPPPWLSGLPIIGTPAAEAWQRIAVGRLADVASAAAPYATTVIIWTAGTMRGIGGLFAQFLLTIAIAAIMYARGEQGAHALLRVGRRLAGEAGDDVVRRSAQAIRSLALGVVVTALVQAALTGVGLAVAGVPVAALLAAIAFALCIAQVGPILVLGPAVAWLYWQGATTTATALLAWTVLILTLDNVMRPILMSKGAGVPLLLMLAGVIGGLFAFGLIGIFVGPVILTVSHTLLGSWLNNAPNVVATESRGQGRVSDLESTSSPNRANTTSGATATP